MKKAYLELVRQIRDAVREKAQEVPPFKNTGNGAIRILAYPCCKAADEWLGGLSDFRYQSNATDTIGAVGHDICDYEHAFAITPGGSRVVTVVEDGVEKKIDTYAFSAMKIAHCSHAQDLKGDLLSGLDLGDPDLTEDYGYGPYLGALCVEIEVNALMGDGELRSAGEFCGIYVCVSGADSADDLKCAFAAVKVIEDFFTNGWANTIAFRVNTPDVPSCIKE